MSGKIFINYRRGDDPGNTGRLFDQLEDVFPRDQLFIDVDSIPPGRDFVHVLEEQVAQCDVLLAIIGKNWIDARDEQGLRRLDNPDDFVRIEIESALKQDKLVIPILVHDGRMPRADELPDTLRPLTRRNAVRLTHERFKAEAQGLIKAIKQALEDEERRRQEDAARRQAQEQREAEQRAEAERQQARQAAVAGLSADQIAKAEELAHWDFIKASENAQDVRDHLARFPGGVTERFARARLEEVTWIALGATPTLDQLTEFLSEFPAGTHAKAALARRAVLEHDEAAKREASERAQREDEAWTAASNAGDVASLEAFVRDWSASRHAGAARVRIKALGSAPSRRALVWGGGAAGLAVVSGWLIWMAQPRSIELQGPVAKRVKMPPPVEPQPPSARTYPLTPRERLIRTFTGHESSTFTLVLSPDGRTMFSDSGDKTIKLWDIETGENLRTLTGHSGPVWGIALSPDGRTILSGSEDKTLKLWEVATGKVLRTFTGHDSGVTSVALSSDGRTALSASEDKTLKLWEVATGKELRTFTGHTELISTVAYSPDGLTALSAASDKTAKVWTVATGAVVSTFEGHKDYVASAAFSPDGRTMVSASADRTLKLWEVATGSELRTFSGHAETVHTAAFAPDGRTILSGSSDKTLRLWETASGRQLHMFTGHTGDVYSVAFARDGRTALSGSGDFTIKLWDLTGL